MGRHPGFSPLVDIDYISVGFREAMLSLVVVSVKEVGYIKS